MRVISQDGTIDMPYESVVIQRFGREIYFLNKNLTGVEHLVSDIDIATYSTEEKAKKAMKMIRIVYENNEFSKLKYCSAFLTPSWVKVAVLAFSSTI